MRRSFPQRSTAQRPAPLVARTVGALVLALAACVGCKDASPTTPPTAPKSEPHLPTGEDVWTQAIAFSNTRPQYEQPLGDGRLVPVGLPDVKAATCGQCHPNHFREWKTSIHAAAWTDPQFVEERDKGATWLCINCHTPLRVQQESFPIGLRNGDVEKAIEVKNPNFDRALQQEGITCAGCHVRKGAIVSSDRAGRGKNAPHPVVKDAAFVDGSALCLRCHQAIAEYPGKAFVCTFNTGNEWKDGPYPGEKKTCVSCHMPTVNRAPALGAPAREGHQHYWRGSGIPKFVDGPSPPVEANPPGLSLAAAVDDDKAQVLVVTAKNARAGHKLPTGDPERAIVVKATFLDVTGTTVSTETVATFRQHWEWYPAPNKLRDNRLAPKEERTYRVPIPAAAVRATVTAVHERMSVKAAEYHGLVGRYPIALQTHAVEVVLPSSRANAAGNKAREIKAQAKRP